jgi:hypothetical protein
MKKIIDAAMLGALAAIVSGVMTHFDVPGELSALIENMVQEIMPWIEISVQS